MKIDHNEIKTLKPNNDSKQELFSQIELILSDLRPYITSHGGDVSLIKVEDQIVFIKFTGTCVSCPLSFYTVTYGIERHIKSKIPEIIRVEVIEE